MIKFLNKVIFILGVFITMIGLKIKVGGFSLYPSSLLLICLILLLLLKNKGSFAVRMNFFILWIFINIFSSCLVIFLNRGNDYLTQSLSFVFQIIFLWSLLFFLINKKDIDVYIDNFERGFKLSIVLQVLWAVGEFLSWQLFNFQLNSFIFGDVLGLNYLGRTWTVLNYTLGFPLIRVSGIGWDPAYLAILLVIGFFIFKNIYFKVLMLIVLILTSSRTGLLCFILVSIISLVLKKRKKIKICIRGKIQLTILTISILLLFFFFINKNEDFKKIYTLSKLRYSKNNSTVDHGDKRHVLYYPLGIEVITTRSNIIRMFVGYGFRTSNYAFDNHSDISEKLHIGQKSPKPWIPETDWIAVFLGNGIIGTLLYVAMIFSNIYYNRKNEFLLYSNLAIFFSGISYTYLNLQWVLFVLMISSLKYNIKLGDRTDEHRN